MVPQAPAQPPPPPPLSPLAANNIPVSVPEPRQGIKVDSIAHNNQINHAELDNGELDSGTADIHFSATNTAAPFLTNNLAALPSYLKAPPCTTSLRRKPRVTMRPSHLPRSATSPDLPSSPTDSTTSEAHETAPNRDGAISRVDRYSQILPAAPTNPPPPPPTIASSSRPSGLRHVTFASEIKPSMQGTIESSSSLPPQISLPIEIPRKHRFRLNTARQGMQKALSSMRTHASPSNITGLSLRKKASGSASETPAGSASSASAAKKILISAPTGMIKKTPEEIQEMLRQLGVNARDLPSSGGSGSFDKNAVTGEDVEIGGRGDEVGQGMSEVQKGKRTDRANSITSQSTSNSRSTFASSAIPPYPAISISTSTPKPYLSAKQLGKLPARSTSPSPPPSPSHTQCTTPAKSTDAQVPKNPEQEKKPVGWYTTATLDEIRATLPPVRKEDLIPDEEIPEFVEELMRDLEVLKSVSRWRSEQLDAEIEEVRKMGLRGRDGDGAREDEDGMDDEEESDNEEDEDEEDEEEYIWGQNGEPDPRFIDSGWCQEEISSAGIGARWFIFDDVENILGGPKCPLTHPAHDIEEEENEDEDENQHEHEHEHDHITETQNMIEKPEEITTGNTQIDEHFAAEEDFDEDARQITQEEMMRGEFTQLEILEREGMV
ncbi:hypothetical protein EAF04_004918 [Stromatinia cepivora]|nr:hypothetical protein EAF04_004918 [Stromatinia cepivora]